MNERFKELAEKHKLIHEYMTNGERYDALIRYKKFARLIVRECLDQCYNRGMNDALYEGQLKAAAYIEEHFGIEQ